MKKNTVKLNEAALREIVAESVKKVLNEIDGISSPVQTKPSITEIVNRLNVAASRAWGVVDMYDEYLTAVLNVLPDRAEAKTLAVAFNKVVRHILEYAEAFKNLAKKYANTPEYKAMINTPEYKARMKELGLSK